MELGAVMLPVDWCMVVTAVATSEARRCDDSPASVLTTVTNGRLERREIAT